MPLLTLTSDIGERDYLSAAIKGRLLSINPEFKLIDVSHSITPFNYPQAAYVCRNALKNFPEFSYHIILVNLFEKKPEKLLLAFHHNQYILCADNGLLTMILEEKPEMVMGIQLEKNKEKNTLYCVDVLGKTINRLINGEAIQNIGQADTSYIEKNPLRPAIGEDWIDGQIIFIDNFENVVANITFDDFEKQRKGRKFKISFKRDEKLALFNSAGYLEIAINKGNAAGLLGLKGYSEINNQSSQMLQNQLYYKTVRISFQ
jgi:S-adenosyl-L-methionine hydrolase (adenosine-forming)